MGAAPKMGLRVPPGRPVVGVDEFAVKPLRVLMSTSERFLEIACLHALLHNASNFSHKPCDHPVCSIPSQNPFQFRIRLRFHASLVPKLTVRRMSGRSPSQVASPEPLSASFRAIQRCDPARNGQWRQAARTISRQMTAMGHELSSRQNHGDAEAGEIRAPICAAISKDGIRLQIFPDVAL
jgi:hypothetical protein